MTVKAKLPRSYYAMPATKDWPYEHVGHFLTGKAPKGARSITAAEAKTINAAVTARSPKPVAAPVQAAQPAAPTIDLQSIHDQIAALTTVVQAHAGLHDKTEKDIAEVKTTNATTAKQVEAVKASTDHFMSGLSELGGKPA